MKAPLPVSNGHIALLALLVVSLVAFPVAGQRSADPAPAAFRFHDWSTRHVVYAQTGSFPAIQAAQADPRARFRWREVQQAWLRDAEEFRQNNGVSPEFRRLGPLHPPIDFAPQRGREVPHGFLHPRIDRSIHADWSISLGNGAAAQGMFPAKFSFDVNAAPSCANDF